MSLSHVCVNCGREIILEIGETDCYLCHKNAYKKEDDMPVDITELPSSVIEQHGLHEEVKEAKRITAANDLPPVPPRPASGGSGKGNNNIVVKAYYDEHRVQIETEIKAYGAEPTKKRWKIPDGTWAGLMRRWAKPPSTEPRKTRKTVTPRKEIPGNKELPDGHITVNNGPDMILHGNREKMIYLLGFMSGAIGRS